MRRAIRSRTARMSSTWPTARRCGRWWKKERPHIIVPEIEAIATDMLAQIEKEGIATVIPAARAAQLTMNREGIRRLAAEELDLPTSRYAFADSVNEMKQAIDGGIGYPCIVKPVMSSSGKGQSTINGPGRCAKSLGLCPVRRAREPRARHRRGDDPVRL